MKDQIILTFLRYLKPYTWKLVLTLGLISLASFGTLASPYILKVIIDDLFPAGDYEGLLNILGVLIIVNVLRILIEIISDYLRDWIGGRVILDIRKDLFSHVLRLPMSFFNTTQKGDIIQRLGHEVDIIERALTSSAIRFVYNVLTILGLGVALSMLNFKLFLLSITVIPVIYLTIRFFQVRIQKAAEVLREKEGSFIAFMLERLENIELVKGLNRQSYEVNNLTKRSYTIIGFSLKETLLASGNAGIITFLISLAPIIVFSWGGKGVMTGAMSVGALVAFLQYLNRLFSPFRDLMRLYVELVQAKSYMKRVFSYFSLPTVEPVKAMSGPLDLKEHILFNKVNFSYNGESLIRDFDFRFEKGKNYVLVGKSGAGKSTLMKLLGRYYTPTRGSIYLDEADIESMDSFQIRSTLYYTGQNHQFFNHSIVENIKYGNLDSSEKQAKEASKLVGIDGDIMKLPHGYYTPMGDQGVRLSGGQKQLIAIARSLLTDRQVLIFDEATAALDSLKEEKLWKAILNNYQEKTILAISHRLSTILKFDTILCLHDGKVVEWGSHDHLISNKNYYYELMKDQLVYA